mmetsp:Transcript_86487/g.137279  ORF Transcript_86487/g.137279 Transcript_86487/m.137279 type:complete len:329 (-) Transcript_86487:409-1395(-)
MHGRAAAGGLLLLLCLVAQKIATVHDALHVLLKALTRIQADDGRWRFLCAQAVVVSRMRHGAADHLVILSQAIGQTGNGGDVQLGAGLVLARIEEIQSCVGSDGPVCVLSAAVDAGKRLLMEEHLKAELRGLSVHDLHEEHVAIAGDVGRAEDGGHLVLSWSHFIVLHGHGAAHLQHLSLGNVQELSDLPRDGLEVVQISLLVTSWKLAKEGPAAIHQIRAGLVVSRREDEELLLPSKVAVHGLRIGANANGFQHAEPMGLHRVHGAQQRSFLIDALAKVGHKSTWDVEALVHDKGWGRPVPSGEGRCGVRHAQPAVGKGGAVGLALE